MKTTKKLLAVLLSVAMVLAMSVTTGLTAFAANTDGSITITDTVEGQTYNIYEILTLESYDANTGAYVYKAASTDWEAFLTSTDAAAYVSVDSNGYVTWANASTSSATAAAFAALALTYANTNNISPTASTVAAGTTVTFTGLDTGYYLVESTTGTLVELTTTDPNVTINEKNDVPELLKHVLEGSTWGETNNVNVGETVYFKSVITAATGAESYIYHDTLGTGLTFDSTSVEITYTNNVPETYTLDASYYTLVYDATTDPQTFTIEFDQSFLNTVVDGWQITITYEATLNEDALISTSGNLQGNTNTAYVSYGDNSNYVTATSVTNTYTYQFDVYKYTGSTPLAGATFTLALQSSSSTLIQFVEESANVYRVATAEEIADSSITKYTEITTDSTGTFTLKGLDAGSYYLTETEAPTGYQTLSDPIEVEITSAGVVRVGGLIVSQVEVENNTGSKMPVTGGIGTTIFYIIGAILVIGAGVLLVVRRRMNNSGK